MPQRRFITFGLLALTLFYVLFTTSRTATAHQYLVNGSFEDGTEAWSILSDGSTFDTAPDAVHSSDGLYRGRIVLGQANFRLNQSIADVPPGTYQMAISVRVESTNAVVKLEVLTDPTWAERPASVTFTATPGEWQHLVSDIVIPGASWVSIRMFGSGNVGDRIYIDGVRFDGAAPATMTPTYTHTPLPPTNTPVPPTATKTPRETTTASPEPTSTTSPALSHAIATGTLANGGFEDVAEGKPLAWSKYGGSLSVAASPVRTGGHAARLESVTDSTKWLYQTVVVTGGSSYSFDAWLRYDDPNVASAFLRISWYASVDGSGEAIGTADSLARLETSSADWRYLTTSSVAAPADARTAKLRIMLQPTSTALASIYADDAAFAPADPALSTSVQQPGDANQTSASSAQRSGASSANPGGRQLSSTTDMATTSRIVISEILYDSLEPQDSEGEWIELYNAGIEPVDLRGWAIADNKYADFLPAHMLEPGNYVVIVASDNLSSDMIEREVAAIRIAGNIGNSLNNSGDVVALIDPSGRFADVVSWGDNASAFDPAITDVPAGHSIARRSASTDTNTANDFIDSEQPSPGLAYTDGSATEHRPAVATSNNVQVLSGESGSSFGWIAWALAAGSMGILAVVAAARLGPVVTQRLRHQ